MAKQHRNRSSNKTAPSAPSPRTPARTPARTQGARPSPVKAPIDTRTEIAKQIRLWVLSLICAGAGAGTVYGTGSLVRGIGVFLLVLVVLGPLLFFYEKRQTARRAAESARPATKRSAP